MYFTSIDDLDFSPGLVPVNKHSAMVAPFDFNVKQCCLV